MGGGGGERKSDRLTKIFTDKGIGTISVSIIHA